jgi:phage/conjugal plasmid C-4 type zinc finger TraR family protein
VADMVDEAQDKTESERARLIANARAATGTVGSTHCISCGDIIPKDRRHANPSATRCTDCQEHVEAGRTS